MNKLSIKSGSQTGVARAIYEPLPFAAASEGVGLLTALPGRDCRSDSANKAPERELSHLL